MSECPERQCRPNGDGIPIAAWRRQLGGGEDKSVNYL
jgi:hypothetical protein